MLPVIRVFGLTIAVGPLLTLGALWVGAELAGRALERLFSPPVGRAWRESFANASLWALLVGLAGARLWYAAVNAPVYLRDPWLLFSLRPDTLVYTPGLIAGFACLTFLARRKHIPLTSLIDAVGLGSIVVLALFALRDYLVGSGYGMPLLWPWAPQAEGWRHPVQLYEAALLSVLVLGLWFTLPARSAQTFWRLVLGYSLIRLVVEAFRGDAWLLTNGIRGAQVVALASAWAAMYVLSFYTRQETETRAHQVVGEAHQGQEV